MEKRRIPVKRQRCSAVTCQVGGGATDIERLAPAIAQLLRLAEGTAARMKPSFKR